MYFSSVLQYNTPFLAIHLISLAIHLHFPCNTIFPHAASHCLSQYNFVYCNTLPAHPRCLIAIQFPVLQYNFPTLKPSLAIQLFTKKNYIAIQTISHQAPLAIYFPSLTKVAIQCLGLQYNCLAIQFPYNTMPCLAIQLQYNGAGQPAPFCFSFFFNYFFLHYFQLLEKHQKNIYMYIIFFLQNIK